jgi:hypothetical protein
LTSQRLPATDYGEAGTKEFPHDFDQMMEDVEAGEGGDDGEE